MMSRDIQRIRSSAFCFLVFPPLIPGGHAWIGLRGIARWTQGHYAGYSCREIMRIECRILFFHSTYADGGQWRSDLRGKRSTSNYVILEGRPWRNLEKTAHSLHGLIY